jgi:4-carboxymuconolactone decarboxylase
MWLLSCAGAIRSSQPASAVSVNISGRGSAAERCANERSSAMTDEKEPTGAEKLFGDFAPALVHFTDDVLFGEVWPRQELSSKERSLVTVASLVTGGNTEQLVFHLGYAKESGASEQELIEAITHLAFYAGWPKAMAAMAVAKRVFNGE